MTTIYDIGIVGAGVAGAFATYKLAKNKGISAIIFDLGRPPRKRKRQIDGWLGCLPSSDGKLYLNDVNKVSTITGARKAKSTFTSFNKILSNVDNFEITKDRSPSISMNKKLKKAGYDVLLNDHIQLYPKDIHMLSKYMADSIEENKNITFKFDDEVRTVYKQKGNFVVVTEDQEYKCKKLIIAVGRSGWRWVKDLYSNFGIIESNDTATFGIRVETTASIMKDFNKSNCTITKGNEWEIGPLSWFGTIIPEDHLDMAISAFRSNENRWKSDKVSFSLIANTHFPNYGVEQTDRIAKLSFLLANDRIIKEKVSYILNDKSKISVIPEYNWLKNVIKEFSLVLPEIATKAYYHIPTILPMAPKINLGNNFESEMDGMFVVGESAGVHGILAAACMGLIVGESVCK